MTYTGEVTADNFTTIFDLASTLLHRLDLSPVFYQAVLAAIEEVYGELLRQAPGEVIKIEMAILAEKLRIEVHYRNGLPLAPELLGEFTLGTGDIDLEDINTDTLWLHQVKHWMDRVRLFRSSKEQKFIMERYFRPAHAEKQLWVLSVAPRLLPRIIVDGGEPPASGAPGRALLKDTGTGKILELDWQYAWFASRFDGSVTVRELYLRFVDEHGLIHPSRLEALYKKLEAEGMLDETEGQRSTPGAKRVLLRFLNPDFSIRHADRAVTAVYHSLGFLATPAGFFLMLLIALSGLVPLWLDQTRIVEQAKHLPLLVSSNPTLFALVYLGLFFIVIIHEFGHGVASKHYGCRIYRLGLMFYLAAFIFYCDVSSSWRLKDWRQRAIISLAGPLTTFALGSCLFWCSFFISSVLPGLDTLVLALACICYISLLFNLNPFLRLDGYYVLMDWSGIKNLRSRSFRYLRYLVFRLCGTTEPAQAEEFAGVNRAFLLGYGLLGTVFTVIFFLLPFYEFITHHAAENRLLQALAPLTLVFALVVLVRFVYSQYYAVTHRDFEL